MHRVGYPFFVAAAFEFARQGQLAGALVAVAAEIVLRHATWAGPALDKTSYATGLPERDLDLLDQFERLGVFARAMTIGLGVLGPTLFVWALVL